MKILLAPAFFIFTIVAYAQDTTFYDADWHNVNSFENSSFYEIVQFDPMDSSRTSELTYFKSGKLKKVVNFKSKQLDGCFKEWYENGQLRKDLEYKDGHHHGQLFTYWENGNPKRLEHYENGQRIDGKCFNPDGTETSYYEYERMPVFAEGEMDLINYLSTAIQYPTKARRKGIEGKVLIEFMINKDGTIFDVKILKSVSKELDAEALRVIKNMPKWEPGMQDGEAFWVTFSLPILFKLN